MVDAAHIVPDADEEFGLPVVRNGLTLSKMHHAAFDAGLIGIDPDFRVHVSLRLMEVDDGPMLEQGIKVMVGRTILLPERAADRPDRDKLAQRSAAYEGNL